MFAIEDNRLFKSSDGIMWNEVFEWQGSETFEFQHSKLYQFKSRLYLATSKRIMRTSDGELWYEINNQKHIHSDGGAVFDGQLYLGGQHTILRTKGTG